METRKHRFDLKTGKLETYSGKVYCCSCNVRNLTNGQRHTNEVVRTIPGGRPYNPRRFPTGTWRVTEKVYQKEEGFDRAVYGPVKIRTNAETNVAVWALDDDGDYAFPTREIVRDTGYCLHESPRFKTTLGCIRLPDKQGLEIASEMKIGDYLEVA
jgi:hypothetical protein